jgi:putative membrane protein
MKHLKSSLSTVSVVAVVLGMVACGGESRQQPANAPVGTSTEYAQQTAPPATATPDQTGQYGSAMGQPGSATTGGETGSMSPTPSTSTAPSTAEGASGQLNPQYGQGQMGQGQMGQTNEQTAPPAGAMGTTGGTMDVSSLNDAQLAAVIQAINQGEIQEAQLAQQRATNPEVKKFARDMVTSHRTMMNDDQSVLTQAQITPSDNAVSQQLRTDSQSEMSTLEGLRGKDFDHEYMDSQIKDHNKALELIDRIIPNVKNTQLKADLQNARPRIEAHLREAERVQQKLQPGSTNMQNQNPNPNPNPNQNQNQNQGGSQNPY